VEEWTAGAWSSTREGSFAGEGHPDEIRDGNAKEAGPKVRTGLPDCDGSYGVSRRG